jgi:hypothetical protein
MGEALSFCGMGLIKFKAAPEHVQDLIMKKNSRHVHSKSGMPPQPPPEQNAIANAHGVKGSGGAGPDTFAAAKAGKGIYLGPAAGQADGMVRAGRYTAFTLSAGRLSHPGYGSGNNPHISNLGPGAGIGAAGNGHPERVMELEVSFYPGF